MGTYFGGLKRFMLANPLILEGPKPVSQSSLQVQAGITGYIIVNTKDWQFLIC